MLRRRRRRRGGDLQVRKLGWCDILSYCVNNLYFNTTEEVNINRQDTSHRIQEVSICAKLMSIYVSICLSIHLSSCENIDTYLSSFLFIFLPIFISLYISMYIVYICFYLNLLLSQQGYPAKQQIDILCQN